MIIGLGFMARSGKDTVADYLVEQHGFKKAAFADRLKAAAGCIFGLSMQQLYGDQKEEIDQFWNDTPRNILQKMGTECMRRGYRDDIWIQALFRYIELDGWETKEETNWVVSDVRFPNEAQAIKDHKGMLIQINRPELGQGKIATKMHASETAMVNYHGWDHVITNDGSIQDLYDTVSFCLKSVL